MQYAVLSCLPQCCSSLKDIRQSTNVRLFLDFNWEQPHDHTNCPLDCAVSSVYDGSQVMTNLRMLMPTVILNFSKKWLGKDSVFRHQLLALCSRLGLCSCCTREFRISSVIYPIDHLKRNFLHTIWYLQLLEQVLSPVFSCAFDLLFQETSIFFPHSVHYASAVLQSSLSNAKCKSFKKFLLAISKEWWRLSLSLSKKVKTKSLMENWDTKKYHEVSTNILKSQSLIKSRKVSQSIMKFHEFSKSQTVSRSLTSHPKISESHETFQFTFFLSFFDTKWSYLLIPGE